jgi:hypothetical protein
VAVRAPQAFKNYYNIADPAQIQRRAEAEAPLDEVVQGWAVGTDPKAHIEKIHALFDSGVTIVNIPGSATSARSIEFYGEHVLPDLRQRT